jgi:hypothetical protein
MPAESPVGLSSVHTRTNFRVPPALRQSHELYRQIDETGHEELPEPLYEQWLKHVEKLKQQTANEKTTPVRNTFNK